MANTEGHLHIAIDGPAASGKSSVALELAKRLDIALIDSGSMYRAVTLLALEGGAPVEDHGAIIEIAEKVSGEFRLDLSEENVLRVFVGDREVTHEIRSPAVGAKVSPVSEIAGVRDEMVRLQRQLACGRGAVMEGRDIGTTVLPAANLKVFLDASIEERARRRFEEFMGKGIGVTRPQVEREIEERDRIDSNRAVSPLSRAADAVAVDTNGKTVEDVVGEIVEMLRAEKLI